MTLCMHSFDRLDRQRLDVTYIGDDSVAPRFLRLPTPVSGRSSDTVVPRASSPSRKIAAAEILSSQRTELTLIERPRMQLLEWFM